MKRVLLAGTILIAGTHLGSAENSDPAAAKQLAEDVWRASGGEHFQNVKALRFTFIVEQDGKQLLSAEHHWDMSAQTDEVKWKGKDVTVNLASPATDDEGKAAYARWVNDSYWLLAPLKLLDPGVKLAAEGRKESDGADCDTLHLQFEQVGLTPGDQYMLYVDPQTKLLRGWDYMPNPETTMHGTWEKYQTFGPLKLATEHNFGGKVIRFADVAVEMK
jgi:hypothetical protein